MILERLEIQGFKSFAQRTVLEFPHKGSTGKSITAIVGPNGSGKSNISDAVKWVLGEQSLKAIRGKKSQDVIFSGSDKKARLGLAEVSLFLKNGEVTDAADATGAASNNLDREIDPREFSELAITRRLYRDGNSEYLINRQDVRLQDINLLLAKAGFGQKSYQIIGQGMIDAVLMATPVERKDFFDDAVGVKPFQIKRDQALRQLERTENNLWQAEMILKELGPRLRSLTRQVRKLEQRELIQSNLKNEQKKYYGHLFSDLMNQLRLNHVSIEDLEPQIKDHQTKLDEFKNQLAGLAQESSRQEIFNKLQGDYQILLERRNDLLKEQTILKGKKELAFEQQGQINLGWLHRREEEMRQKIAEIEREMTDLDQVAKFKSEKVSQLSGQEKSLLEEIKKWEEKIRHQTLKITDNFSLSDWSKELEQIYLDLENWLKKLGGVKDFDEIGDLKKHLKQLNTRLRELTYKAKTETDRGMIDQWSVHLSTLLQEKERLTPLLNNLKIETAIGSEKKKLMENELAGLVQEQTKAAQKIKEQGAPSLIQDQNRASQENQMEKDLAAAEENLRAALAKVQNFNAEEQSKKEKLFGLEKNYQEVQNLLNLSLQQLNQNKIIQARLETKKEDLEKEITRELDDLNGLAGAKVLEASEFEPLFVNIQKLKVQLELIGGIDPETIKEYQETKERYDYLDEQTKDLTGAMESLEKVISELDSDIKEQFNSAFNKISQEFARFFRTLFGGGQAKLTKLEVEKSEGLGASSQFVPEPAEGEPVLASQAIEPVSQPENVSRARKFMGGTYQGIEIYACPPGKKLASINMLSGGERALASLALIAAIISHNPPPFVVFDEVDAALDEANSHRMAKIIKDLAEKTQFVLITHNRSIMHGADVIYGVTMGLDGVSKLLSVKLEEAADKATRL